LLNQPQPLGRQQSVEKNKAKKEEAKKAEEKKAEETAKEKKKEKEKPTSPTVDLSDQEAVTKRIKALKKEITTSRTITRTN